ncbi:MAG TPA: hypothetical protein VFU13_08055 [Steroidobacteraceae bacterium]|nr:hypothetical protein [Steroidobacteraceae bacterium]
MNDEHDNVLSRRAFVAATGAVALAPRSFGAASATGLTVTTPMPAPEWALLQRELLRAHTEACEIFHARYFDERHHLLCFPRWGTNDGPDDAIEHVNDWPLLHAIGGSDRILELYRAVYEGHLEQYGALRTTEVPMGRQGMYVREFPPQMDWQHISEGLSVFNLMGLSTPGDARLIDRTRRFAGFYDGSDAAAPNYDRKHRVIRSMFNGSIGPLLRPTTALDWAGDPFDASRFELEHGERNFDEFLAHFREYTDTVCDSPLNLQSTTLALNAYLLTGEKRWREWLLSYVDAWVERARANDDILPSKVGLDGRIGGGGKWYEGVYGWNFSPVVPQTGKREDRNRVPRSIVAFMNAALLTGDDRYMAVWRRQNAAINTRAKEIDGKLQSPRMCGPQGWYSYAPGPYRLNGFEIWYLSMRSEDRALAGEHPWVDYLEGRNPGYPVTALRASLERVRTRVALIHADKSTPDTRLADNALEHNPASVASLLQLTQGALHIARPPWSPTSPNQGGAPLHARLRYFDPARRRAGLPEDVAALVDTLEDARTCVTLVNLNPSRERVVTVQGGAYGEHQITSVTDGPRSQVVSGRSFDVTLAPGCGARLALAMQRYSATPSLAFPWK